MLFEHVPAEGVLRGVNALGATDREQHLKLHQEVQEEQSTLADMVRDLTGSQDEQPGEETLFKRSLRDLSNHSFWITAGQIYGGANQLAEAVRRIEIAYGGEKNAARPTPARRLLKRTAG